MPRIKDLRIAQKELQEWGNRFDRYSGNNPDKYQADIRAARRRVRQIEESLKTSGEMVSSDHEKLSAELDKYLQTQKEGKLSNMKGGGMSVAFSRSNEVALARL